jgi:hypothetical protein
MEENAMNKRIALVALLMVSLILAACGGTASSPPEVASVDQARMGDTNAVGAPAMELPSAPESGGLGGGASTAPTSGDRMVVQTANLSIVVADPAASLDVIAQMAQQMGGFVVSSNLYQSTFGVSQVVANQATVTIRVPSERLEEAMNRIKEGATEVRTESVSGEDVTAQFTDMESRLRNLQAEEEQLREIMASATRADDVLMIFNQLASVRGEIEMVQGQMRYYEEATRLAALTVELIPDVANQPIEIGGWHPGAVAREAIENLVRALQSLVDLLIRFGICGLPFLIIIGLPAWLIIRAIVRRIRKPKAVPPAQG